MKRSVAAVAVAVLALMTVGAACGDGRSGPLVVSEIDSVEADYLYSIPAGTGAVFDSGGTVDILPAKLTVHVGEVMRIVNEDDRAHLIGSFYVGAGETLTQRFSTPGEFTGVCTVHPSGQFVLTVEE